jgi:hypothetical protein
MAGRDNSKVVGMSCKAQFLNVSASRALNSIEIITGYVEVARLHNRGLENARMDGEIGSCSCIRNYVETLLINKKEFIS